MGQSMHAPSSQQRIIIWRHNVTQTYPPSLYYLVHKKSAQCRVPLLHACSPIYPVPQACKTYSLVLQPIASCRKKRREWTWKRPVNTTIKRFQSSPTNYFSIHVHCILASPSLPLPWGLESRLFPYIHWNCFNMVHLSCNDIDRILENMPPLKHANHVIALLRPDIVNPERKHTECNSTLSYDIRKLLAIRVFSMRGPVRGWGGPHPCGWWCPLCTAGRNV